jgi:hypothetical protein
LDSNKAASVINGHGPGEYSIDHNPGYDFLRIVADLQNADAATGDVQFAPLYIPVLGVLSACCAIEGYVNMVGLTLDPDWGTFDRGPVPIKDRIKRIYEHVDAVPDFSQGIFQEALNLFKARIKLVHPRYHRETKQADGPLPDVFDSVGAEYPVARSRQISDDTIDAILADTDLAVFKNHWRGGAYRGPGSVFR